MAAAAARSTDFGAGGGGSFGGDSLGEPSSPGGDRSADVARISTTASLAEAIAEALQRLKPSQLRDLIT